MTYDDPRFFRVTLRSGTDSFSYDIASHFGREKAIFMAAVNHTANEANAPVDVITVEDLGPVPHDAYGYPIIGEQWLIDRWEW